jgi:hypothetical protein
MMPTDEQALEVFQNLRLRGSSGQLSHFREALIERIAQPWSRSKADERYSLGVRGSSQGVLVLHRQPDADAPGAKLFLWRNADHYEVSNIVPLGAGELGRSGYNIVLRDFITRVAGPAADAAGITAELTGSMQTLDDWTTPQVASALRLFSRLANKSTGSSHPLDKERWFDFIVKAHASPDRLDTSELLRWLVEAENWGEDEASDLVIEYEFGLGLLDFVNK